MRGPELAIAMVECVPTLVMDVETTGLDPHNDVVCGWVFASEGLSIYVPVRHTGGGNRFDDPAPFERGLARAFAKRTRLGLKTIGHNLPFDAWFAAKQGVILEGPLEDTMLNAVLINDEARAYDLDHCAIRFEVPAKQGELLYQEIYRRFKIRGAVSRNKAMANFHLMPGDDPLAVEYAVGDGITTHALWQAQQPILDRDELRRVHGLECALLPYLAAMRRRGIRVDKAYAHQALARLEADYDTAMAAMPANFNPNAAGDVRRFLAGEGATWFPQTKLGKDSFRESFLEESEAGQRVIQLRRLLKTRTTFLEPILQAHAVGTRIYPELVQFATGDYGVAHGRFSCRNPNLQAFPKRRREIGEIVRPVLIPDPGWDFGEADVSQQEPRLYAHYGEDTRLIAGYTATPPTDVHAIASELMHIDRERAKTLGLSIFNGMQATSLGNRLKVSRIEAADMRARFLEIFPGIRRFMQDAPRIARARGFIKTLLGRRCYFAAEEGLYRAVSRVIQGSAADQMKAMMLRAFQYEAAHPERLNVLLSIHDSVMFQIRKGTSVKPFKAVLEDNAALGLVVPLPVEIKLGSNWGEASYTKVKL